MSERLPSENAVLPPDAVPSTRALVRATIVMVVFAIMLFVCAVLPAEYNIDPTGIGQLTGLKEIGEIKEQARKEAAGES